MRSFIAASSVGKPRARTPGAAWRSAPRHSWCTRSAHVEGVERHDLDQARPALSDRDSGPCFLEGRAPPRASRRWLRAAAGCVVDESRLCSRWTMQVWTMASGPHDRIGEALQAQTSMAAVELVHHRSQNFAPSFCSSRGRIRRTAHAQRVGRPVAHKPSSRTGQGVRPISSGRLAGGDLVEHSLTALMRSRDLDAMLAQMPTISRSCLCAR